MKGDIMMNNTLCYDMKTLQEVIPLGKNRLYDLVHSEGFPRISVGKRIIIPKKALEEWLEKTAFLQSNS